MDQKPIYKKNIPRLKEFKGAKYYPSEQSTKKNLFNELYKRLYIPIYSFARKFVEVQDAEDIVADTFLKLWKSDVDYTIAPKVKAWLFTCARNSCIDLLNAKKKLPIINADNIELEFSEMPSETEFQIREELFKRLMVEVEKLPPKCKRVFK